MQFFCCAIKRGASFFADIVRGTGHLKSEVESALWEPVTAGEVTADGFDNLRALIDPKRRSGQGRGRTAWPRHSTSRWSTVFLGEVQDCLHAVESVRKVLLERYGIVFREITVRGSLPLKWRELLHVLRRMEDRSEVHGGRFVDGFTGEQVGLPVAVESLRVLRKTASKDTTVAISPADPLNLVGIVIPGSRVAALSKQPIILRGGMPLGTARDVHRGEDRLPQKFREETPLRIAGEY